MTPATGYTQVRGRCRELVASLHCQAPYHEQIFAARLGLLLGTTVWMIPLRLPMTCTALWLGFTGTDRICYNADWPAHQIDLAGHAIGHLLLGHCGDARDGGQFACTAGGLGEDDRGKLSRLVHDQMDGTVSRLFSDGEERAAEVFSRVLAGQLGIRREPADDHWSAGDRFVCVG